MERRAFLTGLIGVAGAAALASVAAAAPIARPIELLDDKPEPGRTPANTARTPDGTPVEQAQVVVRVGPRRRYWRRRYYARRYYAPRYYRRRRYWR